MPDFAIVGQGLAGTCLAWRLRRLGCRLLILDSPVKPSSSRIAAGLLTPITGQRMAKSWRLEELWPTVEPFYRDIEMATGERFFHTEPMIRLFANRDEVGVYRNRAETILHGWTAPLSSDFHGHDFDASYGGFVMPRAARLDVAAFLDASRAVFRADNSYHEADFDPVADVKLSAEGVALPRFGVTVRGVIFCEGFAAAGNPWFPQLQFNPVKGEILTLRIPGLRKTRVIHRGVWLAPAGRELYRAGATYEREQIDTVPTPAGRHEILSRLREFLRHPVEVVDHHAGVRPVIRESRPVVATHPEHGSRLAIFNGLGSKGSLIAPHFAEVLARNLVHGEPIEPAVGLPRIRGHAP